MNGNIGKQHVEANTTLPSAAKLARIVRPDPDDFTLVSIMMSLLVSLSLWSRLPADR
jgi:hypothetical protein